MENEILFFFFDLKNTFENLRTKIRNTIVAVAAVPLGSL